MLLFTGSNVQVRKCFQVRLVRIESVLEPINHEIIVWYKSLERLNSHSRNNDTDTSCTLQLPNQIKKCNFKTFSRVKIHPIRPSALPALILTQHSPAARARQAPGKQTFRRERVPGSALAAH